jgi:hypothetical protein
MKWSAIAVAWLVAAASAAAQQPQPSAAQQSQPAASAASATRMITLQGCVRAGVNTDQVLVTDVVEKAAAGQSALPAEAHGRRVLFWLDQDQALKPHVGHMVEVTGVQGKIEKSEIELKQGRQKDGGLVVEFEGPGRDVKASNDVVGQPLGTSGRVAPEKNDIPTFLVHVHVENVQPLNDRCQ